MCLICVEWQKGNLTTKEAFRNLGEQLNVANDDEDHEKIEHLLELSNKIMDSDLPFQEGSDEDLTDYVIEKYGGNDSDG